MVDVLLNGNILPKLTATGSLDASIELGGTSASTLSALATLVFKDDLFGSIGLISYVDGFLRPSEYHNVFGMEYWIEGALRKTCRMSTTLTRSSLIQYRGTYKETFCDTGDIISWISRTM